MANSRSGSLPRFLNSWREPLASCRIIIRKEASRELLRGFTGSQRGRKQRLARAKEQLSFVITTGQSLNRGQPEMRQA